MTDASRSPSLEDAYSEGRKDERAAIVAFMIRMHQTEMMRHNYALYYARLIEQMDIQKPPTS